MTMGVLSFFYCVVRFIFARCVAFSLCVPALFLLLLLPLLLLLLPPPPPLVLSSRALLSRMMMRIRGSNAPLEQYILQYYNPG